MDEGIVAREAEGIKGKEPKGGGWEMVADRRTEQVKRKRKGEGKGKGKGKAKPGGEGGWSERRLGDRTSWILLRMSCIYVPTYLGMYIGSGWPLQDEANQIK